LGFSSIVVGSLRNYPANPVLALPALVGFLGSFISEIVFSDLIDRCSFQATMDPCFMSFARYSVVSPVVLGVVGLFLVLGSVAMTEQVVLGNQASMSGWARGIRLHFAKVFVVLLVFGAIGSAISVAEAIAISTLIFTRLFSQVHGADLGKELIMANAWAGMAWDGLMGPLVSFLSIFSYLCLASSVLDRRGLRASMRTALRMLKHDRGVFFSFVLLLWAVGFAVSLLSEFPLLIGIAQPTFGASTPSSIVSHLAGSVISPLWYLIAFTFYAESRT
jgi:hypothetical protein